MVYALRFLNFRPVLPAMLLRSPIRPLVGNIARLCCFALFKKQPNSVGRIASEMDLNPAIIMSAMLLRSPIMLLVGNKSPFVLLCAL